jgi:conjugative transposon TraN protein
MKYIYSNIIFFLLLLQTSFAQQISSVKAKELTLCYDKTLHLVFKSDVKYFDIGSDELVAIDKPAEMDNIIRLKANEEDFTGSTNVTVVTTDGKFHSYIVSYSNTVQTYVSELEQYKEPPLINVCETKSTHLIFPNRIKYVDYGNNTIKANSTVINNIIKTQALNKNFAETNVSVVTDDNKFYTLNIAYDSVPAELSYLIDKDINEENKLAVFDDKELNTDDRAELCGKIYNAPRYIRHLAVKQNSMAFTVFNIFVQNDIILIKFELENKSSIPYTAEFIKFYIQDKKISKKTAAQEVVIEPLFLDNFKNKIDIKEENKFIAAFEKFTIPDDKNLIVEIQEQNGGRHFKFIIKNKDIVTAQILK